MNQTNSTLFKQSPFKNTKNLALLALLVIGSKIAFLIVAWLLPALSQFTLLGDTISELAIGRYGSFQTAAFIYSGLGSIGLAYAIRKMTAKSKKSLIGSLLIAIYGAGAILSAFFPTDRVNSPTDWETLSATGAIHVMIALVSFLCVIIGMITLTWTFRNQAKWKALARLPAVLFSCGAFSLIFAQSQGPLGGLMQRLLVTVISGWLILVAIRARRIATTARKQGAF